MFLVGWGYDTNDNPVPAGSGSNKFKGEVVDGYEVDPKDYLVGPLDVRWDADTGTWKSVSTGGMQKHQHLENSNSDGGPSFSNFFTDDIATASGLGYNNILPSLTSV